MKVFKKLDIQVSALDFDNICIVSPGVVERLLKLIQDRVSNLKGGMIQFYLWLFFSTDWCTDNKIIYWIKAEQKKAAKLVKLQQPQSTESFPTKQGDGNLISISISIKSFGSLSVFIPYLRILSHRVYIYIIYDLWSMIWSIYHLPSSIIYHLSIIFLFVVQSSPSADRNQISLNIRIPERYFLKIWYLLYCFDAAASISHP